jgi:predicted phage-related endonuclease
MPIERINIAGPDGRIDRQTWLALRMQDITASDVGAVLGEGLYGSAAKVWAEKKGLIPPSEMTDAMKRGVWGEAAVVEAIASEYPDWELRRAKIYLRDPAIRLGATPDCGAVIPGRDGVSVIQCKVIAKPVFAADWLDDPDDSVEHGTATPPLAYQLQTLTEAMLTEAACGVLAVLVVDTFKWVLRIFWVERHPEAETRIRTRVTDFWRDYLDADVQPAIDPERDGDLVRRLFPKDDGTEIDLSGDNRAAELVDVMEARKVERKAAEEAIDGAKTELTAKLGAATYGRLADGRIVSWKLQQRSEFIAKATSFRVLRITKGRKS